MFPVPTLLYVGHSYKIEFESCYIQKLKHFESFFFIYVFHIFSLYFRSECELRKLTCGQHVVSVSAAHCRTTALCHEQCPDTPAFVCGSDNRFYKNECIMKKDNCG